MKEQNGFSTLFTVLSSYISHHNRCCMVSDFCRNRAIFFASLFCWFSLFVDNYCSFLLKLNHSSMKMHNYRTLIYLKLSQHLPIFTKTTYSRIAIRVRHKNVFCFWATFISQWIEMLWLKHSLLLVLEWTQIILIRLYSDFPLWCEVLFID